MTQMDIPIFYTFGYTTKAGAFRKDEPTTLLCAPSSAAPPEQDGVYFQAGWVEIFQKGMQH